MRSFCFHVDESARFLQTALSAKDKTVSVICTTIGHVVALWTSYFIASKVCRGEKLDFCNNDGFVSRCHSIGRRIIELI